ncbi:hypothetical protein PGT21_000304 [Puccinia graminis f. sp. tritici]|uniref:Uncharacterized protein n=1 Tax=Puccinia graminis f. sp. tritici TaxID=56615 RepID=A0A5B0MG75_PUCGR|nr:hypothetical protein PGT21_000304 [Puccinia graminis f. sp. tritici]
MHRLQSQDIREDWVVLSSSISNLQYTESIAVSDCQWRAEPIAVTSKNLNENLSLGAKGSNSTNLKTKNYKHQSRI